MISGNLIAELNLFAIGATAIGSGLCRVLHTRSKRAETLLVTAGMTFIAVLSIDIVLTILCRITSVRYDLYLFCFDKAFGEPSFLIGRLFQRYGWFRIISTDVYELATCAFLILAVWYAVTQPLDEMKRMNRAILIALMPAGLIYLLFPVSGPAYAFPNFPNTFPEHVSPHPLMLLPPPNGVPSIHMTIALLLAYFCWRWPLGRILGIVFVALTVTSTLGLGEHYLFDLIVAVPYAMLVLYLSGAKERAYASEETSSPLMPHPETLALNNSDPRSTI
jgi:PAP2 superfamily